jgi:hypothetical protein
MVMMVMMVMAMAMAAFLRSFSGLLRMGRDLEVRLI